LEPIFYIYYMSTNTLSIIQTYNDVFNQVAYGCINTSQHL